MLHGAAPDLSQLHPWGCRVFVHDPTGSKLDARAREGRWVGFDETSRAHRVYWPGRRSVTVERSVRFMPTSETIEVPVEGGRDESADRLATAPSTAGAPVAQDTPVGVQQGRERRIRKESAYVRRLREGEGTVDGTSEGKLPEGMQEGTSSEGDSGGFEVLDDPFEETRHAALRRGGPVANLSTARTYMRRAHGQLPLLPHPLPSAGHHSHVDDYTSNSR